MVHSDVGLCLNKYVVSIAPFSTPAFTPAPPPIQKTALFACFRFLIFHPYGCSCRRQRPVGYLRPIAGGLTSSSGPTHAAAGPGTRISTAGSWRAAGRRGDSRSAAALYRSPGSSFGVRRCPTAAGPRSLG